MFVCPEFGQQVCQGRPGTRRQEVRGFNQQYTPSDEQQDGMRPDGLAWVSCCYYSLPLTLMCPEEPLFASACCFSLPPTPPLLLRHQRRQRAQPQLPRNPTTLPSFLAQQPSGPLSSACTSSDVLVALGWHVTRHPLPSGMLPKETGKARLSRPGGCHLPSSQN